MTAFHLSDSDPADASRLLPLSAEALAAYQETIDEAARQWIADHRFDAAQGTALAMPGGDILYGLGKTPDHWVWAGMPGALSKMAGPFYLEGADHAAAAALGWAVGSYRFDRYRKNNRPLPELIWPEGVDRQRITALASADKLVRDLVNTPANDMGPGALAAAARQIAETAGADYREVVGEALLSANYPLIHAVGRASSDAPRLIDFTWGDEDHPRLTLVGKGVCFDTGGLGIKPSGPMDLMKKDMGGAAHVLGLAQLIMALGLPVQLRVLIPAVENAIAGNAFRPRDVIPSRKGLTVEIGHTDAEGRLVLADALTEAENDDPDLLIDMATLTGAARAALGPDIAPFYTADDEIAAALSQHGAVLDDPVWRLPLWRGYHRELSSDIADCSSVGRSPFAGSITAALFLNKFVSPARSWLHFDIFAWNPWKRPGRPVGAACQAVRALYAMLEQRYG